MERSTIKKDGRRLITVLIAALIFAFNVKIFVRTGGLYPGGATGITILIQNISEHFFGVRPPYSLLNILLNAFPVYIGFRYIGKKFTTFSLLMIFVSSVLVDMIPAYTVTYDTLLIAVFGGLINGCAISLCLSVDATSGGTDFISIYLSQRRGIDSFNYMLGLNVVILSIAGIMFGWDKALYSIIYQYVTTQVIHLLYKGYQQVTMFIVTDHPTEICRGISDISHHGATIMEGKGSYDMTDRSVVYSVISVADSRKVIQEIRTIDPCAFINSVRTKELQGNFYFSPKD